jgi:hypothetical protein
VRVVLGGSRSVNALPEEVVVRLQTWMEADAEFLVGDATGADTAFQAFLHRCGYSNVSVYTSAPELRTNIGRWPVVHIDSGLKSRGADMHTAKDRAMTQVADSGLMVWAGDSAGTLANVLDLARASKDAYLYVVPDGELRCFEAGLGLVDWARNYEEVFTEAEGRLRRFQKRQDKSAPSPVVEDVLFGD